MSRPAPQRGIALITAVLVVSLAVIAATAVLSASNLAIHRANSLQDTEKAWWFATGVEAWIRTILQRDAKNNRIDALNDVWAQPVDFLPVEQGFLRGQVIDAQGRFNLNNFATTQPQRFALYTLRFERLFEELELDTYLAKPLAQAIRDWTDADQTPTPNDGAEDTEYLRLTPPYRTADRLMSSVTELMAIRGMTKEIYVRLLPYVAALPAVDTPINVNTAPEPVLRSLVQKPNAALETFLRDRATEPAEQLSELGPNGSDAIDSNRGDADDALLTVASNFFQLRGDATIGNSRVAIYALYYRPPQGAPLVLARSTDSE